MQSSLWQKKRPWILGIFALFVCPLIFLSTPLKPWLGTGPAVSFLQDVLYPFEYGWFQVKSFVFQSIERYATLHEASVQNLELKRQLSEIQTRVLDYENQEQEIHRLRKLLGFAESYERQVSLGEVVMLTDGGAFQTLRISSGRLGGLTVGMPVVAAKGVVGRVLRVGSRFSDVQLLSDTSFDMDVLLERTRTRGVLRGITGTRCRLELHRLADIRVGDTLITSGVVGGFPKGLPVGRVIRISYESDDVSQLITIQPWVDYHQLEEVVILHRTDPNLQTIRDVLTDPSGLTALSPDESKNGTF